MSQNASPAGGRCCRRVIFEGRVQGVGFRYTTASIARDCGVNGYVRNCADGTVELLAAGPQESVERLLARLGQEFGSNIQGQTVEEVTLNELPDGFEIRR
jgi:acylphosphatase